MPAAPRTLGAFTLMRRLGAGGAAERWLARPPPDRGFPSPIVLAVLPRELAEHESFVRRLVHEARVLANVESPHLPRLLDVGRVDDVLYIATSYIPGWSLREVLDDLVASSGEVSVASAVDVALGAARALESLHRAVDPASGRLFGYVHREITPDVLLIGEDGRPRLVDLGLGTSALRDEAGVVLGRPGYMAPEQARGEVLDARADVYALGAVLFEILTLEPYVKRGPVPVMLRRQADPELRRASSLRGDLPPALDEICARALAPEKAARFSSAGAFAQALAELEDDRPEGEMLSTLVGEMLWGDHAAGGRAEPEAGAEAPTGDITQITVRDLAPPDEESSESFLLPTVATPPPTAPLPRLTAAQAEPRGPPPSETPSPFTPSPFIRPVPDDPALGRGVPLGMVALLMGLTLVAGVGFGALVLGRSREVVPAPLRRAEPVDVPSASARSSSAAPARRGPGAPESLE